MCVECSSNTGDVIICRLCIEEDTVGEESYLKQDEVREYSSPHNTTSDTVMGVRRLLIEYHQHAVDKR